MSEAVTYAIEVGVGLACVASAVGLRRTRRLRWLAILLAVAGLVAIAHGVLELAR
ncbi:MAG: hypothetical protein WD248_01075 [Actinomycetota bacterium]